ncbi:MAG TPA: response regulator [Leptolyngbyaceae cyanobacterium]
MTTNEVANYKLSDQIQIQSQKQFTGRLDVQGSTTWSLYFCLGRLVWVAGGVHPMRRWHRHLNLYCPQIPPNSVRLRESDLTRYWEYQAITVLVKRQKITGEQAVAVIKSNVAEVFFDILQYEAKEPLTFICDRENISDASLTLINPSQALQEAQQVWENWRTAGLANLSPNIAPLLKQPEELEKLASPRVYQTLVKVIDGDRTLRDLAVYIKQDLQKLVRSLIPYIRQKIIGLGEVPDLVMPAINAAALAQPNNSEPPVNLTAPISDRRSKTEPPLSTTSPPAVKNSKAEISVSPPPTPLPLPPTQPVTSPPVTKPASLQSPLIVYVEDSVIDCQIMEEILTKASYRFISIKDSIHALPILLQHKPDAIILDLVMPVANGYEICAQIRRISTFKNTPVIILTGNDGLVDRVRAKLVGATDFLSKPIVDQKVLATLFKHLNNSPSLAENSSHSLGYQAS